MKLLAGQHLLRLVLRTPGNFGSAWGTATLDRPTQKDAWHELPFLPDSALKGVLAGQDGNLRDEPEKRNRKREELYGSPDRAEEGGRPGLLVFGNGDLFGFPLPVADGGVACVFPVLAVARALDLHAAPPDRAVLQTLKGVESTGSAPKVFAWPRLPALRGMELEPLAGASVREAGPKLASLLRHYAGEALPAGAEILVVPSALAALLWRKAAETRTLTAIDGATDTVAAGSLRTIELIPQGTVFLSLVTSLAAREIPLPDHVPIGAWESVGLGWVELSLVGPLPAGAGEAEERPVADVVDAAVPPSEAAIMVEVHEAVQRLVGEPPKLKQMIRSAVGNFGPRAQFSGLEAALAFEYAKAKPLKQDPKTEALAHRWLLAALLTPDPPASPDPEVLVSWLGEAPFRAEAIERNKDFILLRWRWLRRYTEFGLDG
jgi:CRISPR/Cas system CMR subunit Cmr4 (Cas7 group RAMP superfamily)